MAATVFLQTEIKTQGIEPLFESLTTSPYIPRTLVLASVSFKPASVSFKPCPLNYIL